VKFRFLLGALALSDALAGCASAQLNLNTLDLASTVGDIQTQQVLYNLSLLRDNPAAIPTHVDLTTGTASTTNSIAPTFGVPIDAGITAATTIARAVAASPSTTTTTQTTSSLASATATTQLQDQWSQSWAYDPVISGDELRRLRLIYKYGLGLISDGDFIRGYPLIEKPQTIAYSGGGDSGQIYNDPVYCPNIGLRASTGTTEDVTRKQQSGPGAAKCASISINIQIPDEHFLHEPSCIVCIGDHKIYTLRAAEYVNPSLSALHGGWLIVDPEEISPPDTKFLGFYAKHRLYVRQRDLEKLAEFTLFVLSATEQSEAAPTSSSSGAGGGGGAAAKKNNNKLLSLPLGPGGINAPQLTLPQ